MPFPYSIDGIAQVQAHSIELFKTSLCRELEGLGAKCVISANGDIKFSTGFFRPLRLEGRLLNKWLMISSGTISFTEERTEFIEFTYHLRLTALVVSLLAFAAFVSMFSAGALTDARRPVILVAGLVWLGGANYVTARISFRSILTKAGAS